MADDEPAGSEPADSIVPACKQVASTILIDNTLIKDEM